MFLAQGSMKIQLAKSNSTTNSEYFHNVDFANKIRYILLIIN